MRGWFTKYISEGVSEEQIYLKFVDTCLSWGVIPLYCDVDGLYKLIDLDSFMVIKTERLRSSCNEVSSKLTVLKDTSMVLPNKVASGLNELVSSDKVKPLIGAKKELTRLLPSSENEE